MTERITLIATVLNESSSLQRWLQGIESQSRLPDEIVIVDGGSTDGTWEALNQHPWGLPVQLRQVPEATIAAGRNAAIALASNGVIAVTDAGTVAEPDWLECLLEAFDTPDVDVAAGFFVPRLDSRWARALAATTLPDATDLEAARFQPSSRSMAFRKNWWDIGIRYPEWLDYSEDLVWDMAMRRAGARFAFVPRARVIFDVRPTVKAFFVQYLRYARGDGKAGLFLGRHLLRYATYAGVLIALERRSTWLLGIGVPLAALYVRTPIMRLRRRDLAAGLSARATLPIVPLVISLRAVGDVAKMIGYPIGLIWRLRRYGIRGLRTSWKQITPSGQPVDSALTRENQPPTSLPGVESPAARR